ncbi:MAG TPA: ComF family protein [Treponema sp.]|nr:ComF family protein [Treponema sp.]
MRGVFFLREYFFPAGCALCGAGLLSADESWYGLCENCRGTLDEETAWLRVPQSNGGRCDLCGKLLISEHDRCISCRNNEERGYDKLLTVFPYTGKYRALFAAYKFGKNLAVGRFFAEKIAEAMRTFADNENGALPDIVPVPPRPGKIKTAGWDQVEYLTRLLERGMCGDAFATRRCLKRLPSKIQKQLDRKSRLENLRGRIVPVKKAPVFAVILDDVITTGSTMDVCASALKERGSKTVYGISLV